jgi:hypothetical protein
MQGLFDEKAILLNISQNEMWQLWFDGDFEGK